MPVVKSSVFSQRLSYVGILLMFHFKNSFAKVCGSAMCGPACYFNILKRVAVL
jgi:hypothetical protein